MRMYLSGSSGPAKPFASDQLNRIQDDPWRTSVILWNAKLLTWRQIKDVTETPTLREALLGGARITACPPSGFQN